jgi:hypothetical protein
VHDAFDATQRLAQRSAVLNVAAHELDVGRKVGRRTVREAVDLRRAVVEDAHCIACVEEFIGEMRADEPCSTGDQDSTRHPPLHRVQLLLPQQRHD